MSPLIKNCLKVGVPLLLAVLAYVMQVDPMSLCSKGNLPQEPNNSQLDAGTQ